ncbi:MAG: 50S ribosomal protein L23 [Bacillota bacterium]|jgi:large subunit ribosomal protein L23|nr:50S ribosomal protein L23 [Bacillota bacterium]NLU54697.1 50S ribosomal protein L23 [Bacillota bacterium]HOA90462.1 50S ribosomal protein L23 [Bacillota bacterium]HOL12791.1 50S ribosomal protein L23 [Bacillota bacterium]HOP54098.1 50S ribosomal protein L23 [Bacillota bacterium]
MYFPHDIIRKPIVTEKTVALMEQNKYTFVVDKRATKTQIKHAVEDIFNVKVEDVRTMNMKGKLRTQGRYQGYRPDWKKAIVTLRDGDRIEILEGM